MKKVLKYISYTLLTVVGLAYIGFVFILPKAFNINEFKPEIQKLAKEQAQLTIDFDNAQIITTPLLGVGVKLDNLNIKLPDNSTLFSAENIKTRISLPSLFLLTVKVSCLEVNKPFINLEIIDDEDFKIVRLVEDLLNAGKEQALENSQKVAENTGFQFNPAWIKIKVPCVKINNYKLLVNDLKNKHYLDIHGEELILGYFNGKTAKIKTYAELFSDENKNITANIDVKTFLPPPAPALDAEDDPAERIDIPFINPVTLYRNYDLKTNLDTKLRIKNKNNRITSRGYLNIENITLKIANIQLPESYLKIRTFGQNVKLDTNIHPIKYQNIQLTGKINYSKHPKVDMYIKTASIQFNDLLILTKALLDSLQVKNELNQIKAEGSMVADCYIKTNFKRLTSKGFIKVNNGGISVRNLGKVISNANINIDLSENALNIVDSNLLVHNSPVNINGKIDKKSTTDIKVKAEKISLPILFNAFAPKELRNTYNFKSADASVDFNITGKLKNAVASLLFTLENLNLADKANSINISDKKLVADFAIDSKDIVGHINNQNFAIYLPQTKSNISVPELEVAIADKNISIKEKSILLNNKTKINYSGEIIDYTKLKSININANGSANTADLIQIIGKEFAPYIHNTGEIPVKLTVEGNNKKQTIFAQALANNKNFFTPIDFANLQGKDTSIQSVIDLKPGRIKIKKTGLYTRTTEVDEKGNEIIELNEVIGIDGTLEGSRINLLKLTIPEILQGKIFVFPKSNFNLSGRAFVLGETSSPRMRGGFEIRDLSIPELLLTLKSGKLLLRGHEAHFGVQDLLLNGSDIQTKGIISLLPNANLIIPNIDVASKYFNLDKVMKVSELAMKYVPQTPQTQTSTKNTQPADIPVIIQNGSISFDRIITGNIDIRKTLSAISMANNVFYINNLRTNIFKGFVKGDISVNLITMLLKIKLQGKDIDVEKAMLDGANMKNMLSGTANFKTDISLSGATIEEQMKSLKGDVSFTVKDGQFGPFGKIENLIIAENIRESQLFQTALGGVISGLTTIDTTHFSDLSGKLSFENGICHIDPITSLGDILSLHIFGDFDLIQNQADMKVRARMASLISNLLGPIGAINPANLLNSAASLNVVTAKAFSIFCEMVPESELATLPSFANSYVDNAATKFQLVIRGDVAKPLTLIKSFKWLASANEYEQATNFVSSLPEPIEGSTATTIDEMVKEVEAEQKTLKYKVKKLFTTEKENISKQIEVSNTEVKETEIESKVETQNRTIEE